MRAIGVTKAKRNGISMMNGNKLFLGTFGVCCERWGLGWLCVEEILRGLVQKRGGMGFFFLLGGGFLNGEVD